MPRGDRTVRTARFPNSSLALYSMAFSSSTYVGRRKPRSVTPHSSVFNSLSPPHWWFPRQTGGQIPKRPALGPPGCSWPPGPPRPPAPGKQRPGWLQGFRPRSARGPSCPLSARRRSRGRGRRETPPATPGGSAWRSVRSQHPRWQSPWPHRHWAQGHGSRGRFSGCTFHRSLFVHPPIKTSPLPSITAPPMETASPILAAGRPLMNTVELPADITSWWGEWATQPWAA